VTSEEWHITNAYVDEEVLNILLSLAQQIMVICCHIWNGNFIVQLRDLPTNLNTIWTNGE
jgi:hypothetical protein